MASIDISALAATHGAHDGSGLSRADHMQCRKLIEQSLPGTRTTTGRVVWCEGLPKTVEAPRGTFFVFPNTEVDNPKPSIRVVVHLQDHPRVECLGIEPMSADLRHDFEDDTEEIIEAAHVRVKDYLARMHLYAAVIDVVVRWLRSRVSLAQINKNA